MFLRNILTAFVIVGLLFCGVNTAAADDRDYRADSSVKFLADKSNEKVTVMTTESTIKKYKGFTGTGGSCIWPPSFHTVLIDLQDLNISAVLSATLTVRAYDCDNPTTGCDGRPEIDTVLLNSNYIGILTGATDQWSTVSFTIDKSDLVEGVNTVLVYIDTTGTGCWCLGVDWAELALEIHDIDLYVNSTEIVISQTGTNRYRMTAKVRNKGQSDAENVNVRVLETYFGNTFSNEIVNVGTISAGSFKTVTHDFTAFDIGNYKFQVIADPNSEIDETNENNNRGETYKVTGQVKETESGTNPMRRMQVELWQASSPWTKKWTTFTNDDGEYAINLNMEGIEYGANTIINGTMQFSPTRAANNIKVRVITDDEWGANTAVNPNAQPSAKNVAVDTNLRERDYSGKDLQFNAVEGGSIYHAVTQAYLYWMQSPVNFEINFRMDCEVGDDDYVGNTSYYSSNTNTLHVYYTRLSAAQAGVTTAPRTNTRTG